jgi:two-component sensor histidine kinase
LPAWRLFLLDIRTMIVFDAVLLLLSSILAAGFALVVKPRRRELVVWAVAYALLVVGAVLFALRDLVPDFLSVVAANVLILTFFSLIQVGIDIHLGRKARYAIVAVSAAVSLAWFAWFGLVRPDIAYRFVFYNIGMAALSILGAASILSGAGKGLPGVQKMAAGLLIGLAVVNLSRLYFGAGGLPSDIMESDAWEGVIQAIAGTLVTILCFTLLLMHERKENEELARSLGDRELLVREMAHRTKNDLALVDSLIMLERGALAAECAENGAEGLVSERLDALRDRIRCVADAHDRLSLSEDLGALRLDDYLEVVASSLPARPGISVARDFAPAVASFGLAAPLGLAMNELATNALKHAFTEGAEGTVRLSLRTSPAEGGGVAAVLEVRDDGKGAPWPPERPGLGTMIVDSFTEKLGGKLEYSFDGGSVFRLSFAISAEQSRRPSVGRSG